MFKLLRRNIANTLILISAISLIISGVYIYILYQNAFRDTNDVIETYQTIRAINRTLLSVNEAALDMSSFIITGDEKFRKKFPEVIISIQVNLATLSQLVQDDPIEVEMNKKLSVMVNKKIEFIQSAIKLPSFTDKKALSSLISNPNRLELTYSINELINKIRHIEIDKLEKAKPNSQFSITKANRMFILLGSLNVLLILIVYIFTRPFLNSNT